MSEGKGREICLVFLHFPFIFYVSNPVPFSFFLIVSKCFKFYFNTVECSDGKRIWIYFFSIKAKVKLRGWWWVGECNVSDWQRCISDNYPFCLDIKKNIYTFLHLLCTRPTSYSFLLRYPRFMMYYIISLYLLVPRFKSSASFSIFCQISFVYIMRHILPSLRKARGESTVVVKMKLLDAVCV